MSQGRDKEESADSPVGETLFQIGPKPFDLPGAESDAPEDVVLAGAKGSEGKPHTFDLYARCLCAPRFDLKSPDLPVVKTDSRAVAIILSKSRWCASSPTALTDKPTALQYIMHALSQKAARDLMRRTKHRQTFCNCYPTAIIRLFQ